jgi:hypothetical protein
MRIDQAQKINIAKAGRSGAITEWFFDELIGCAGREDVVDDRWRRRF